MTDREEFEKWYEKWKSVNGYYDMSNIVNHYTWQAWQARGELDAVKIKELEAELKDADGAAQILANQKVELSLQVAQLREALEFYGSKFKYGSSWSNTDIHHVMEDRGKTARQALNSTLSQDEWIKRSEIGELTAKLDKAREALEYYADRKNWHKDSQQFGSFEVSDFNIIYNDFYEQNQATRYAGNIAKQALEELDK